MSHFISELRLVFLQAFKELWSWNDWDFRVEGFSKGITGLQLRKLVVMDRLEGMIKITFKP